MTHQLERASAPYRHEPLRPSPESDKDERRGEKKSNRLFRKIGSLALGGALLGAAAIPASQWIENANYDRDVVVRSIDNDNHLPARYRDNVTLTLTGYNTSRQQTRVSAEHLTPQLGQIGEVAWVGHDDREINPDTINHEITEYMAENELETIGFFGSSMGGLVTLEVAALLTEQGTPPEYIILDSTPASYGDLRSPRAVELVQTFNTPFVKNAFAAVQSVFEDQRNLPQAAGDFTYETFMSRDDPDKTTSAQTKAQIDYIKQFDLAAIAQRLSADTKIVYIGGGDRDRIVNTATSYQRITEALPHHVIPYYDTGAPHASPIGDDDDYLRTLAPIIDQFRTPAGGAAPSGNARLLH